MLDWPDRPFGQGVAASSGDSGHETRAGAGRLAGDRGTDGARRGSGGPGGSAGRRGQRCRRRRGRRQDVVPRSPRRAAPAAHHVAHLDRRWILDLLRLHPSDLRLHHAAADGGARGRRLAHLHQRAGVFLSGPQDGGAGRSPPGVPGRHVATVAVRRARAVRVREEVRDPVRPRSLRRSSSRARCSDTTSSSESPGGSLRTTAPSRCT